MTGDAGRRAGVVLFLVALLHQPLPAQLRPALSAGWADLASGPGIQLRLGAVENPVAVHAQAGLLGAGAGIDVSWAQDVGWWSRIQPRIFVCAGLSRRWDERPAGAGWGDVVIIGGTRIPYPGGRGPVADLGLGIFRSLGGDNGNGYWAGLAGRFLVGWAF
jgi:hypothetical protein